MRLVLAGNHQQFADHLRSVYGPGGGLGDPPAREVNRPEDLMGVRAETVEGFFRIGTYWDNPVWGSPAYLQFMEDGVAATRPWAMEWDMEWRQVEAKREPVAPQEMETARDTLRRMEEDFTDG